MKVKEKILKTVQKEQIKKSELEASLITEFMEKFRESLGYYPTVITREGAIENKEGIKMISLNELDDAFDKFLPKLYGKTLKLNTACRSRNIVELRFIFCYIARSMRFTLKDIGLFLNRDHTTIIHALNMFNNLFQIDENFRARYGIIINHIKENQYESSTMDISNKI